MSGGGALHQAMEGALRGDPELVAMGWVDLRTGAVLASAARDEGARDALELAAMEAWPLCLGPRVDSPDDGEGRSSEALVVSDAAVHAFAVDRRRPDRAVVGVARAKANVALLLLAVRSAAALG